ncbi:type II toxin-antitoxin system RelB/DinJ family antitoxin [Desulfurobacterium sp.]
MGTIKGEYISLYIDSEVKKEAEKILSRYGLDLSDAVNIFLTQVVAERGFPFPIYIPNEETEKVLREVEEGKNLEEIDFQTFVKEVMEGS